MERTVRQLAPRLRGLVQIVIKRYLIRSVKKPDHFCVWFGLRGMFDRPVLIRYNLVRNACAVHRRFPVQACKERAVSGKKATKKPRAH